LTERLKSLKDEKQKALNQIKSARFNLSKFERELSILSDNLIRLKEKN